MMATCLPDLVKGVGYVRGNEPLSDTDDRVLQMSAKAEAEIRKVTHEGKKNPFKVAKSFNPDFLQRFGARTGLANVLMQGQDTSDISTMLTGELNRNISLTSPLSSGFVPFDLLAPSRLIYPVYSPVRNKLPRPAGQGTARLADIIPAISGSRTGGSVGKSVQWAIGELNGGSFGNWPNSLPASGSQSAIQLDIPYKFFGLTEGLTWLAQFSGQGFEDISALANLILLQEAMIAEEDTIFSGTKTAVQVPGTPTLTARAAVAGETVITGVTNTNNVYVRVTATNYYGETTPCATPGYVEWQTGDVIDVTVVPSRGGFQYNIYAGAGTTDPSASGSHLWKSGLGGALYTLQGALPTSTATPPTADTGTNNSNTFEGLLSVLDGHAITDASVYPTGFSGVGVNKSYGTILNNAAMYSVCEALWDTGSSADGVAGAFRANPSELLAEGGDAARFSQDLLNNNADASAYQLFISQNEVGGIRAGAAVSEFLNPITRAVIKILVHPWLTQGSAFVMSYTLPMGWTNVANVWEMVMVQDLISVSWPVIDMTFRYSIFEYGSLVCYGPQYCSVLQGLQVSGSKPYS